MIEDNKIVKSIEAKSGGKSGTYWTVTWQDDKRDNIFNGDWLPLLEQSQQEHRMIHFTKEKEGKYYNIKSLELDQLDKESTEPPIVKEGMPPKQESRPDIVMTKSDWGEKDRITRKSIERQTALNDAVELAKLMGADKVTTEKIIATAKLFEAYLEGKEVQPAKSRLVEAAKKLGAEEMPKEEDV